MEKINKPIGSQIISVFLKFLAIVVPILVIIIIIPLFLSIFKGNDIQPVDDSSLQLQIINIPEEENAFYDLDKIRNLIDTKNVPEGKELVSDYLESDQWDQEIVAQLLADNEEALQNFTFAAAKGVFQLPDADNPSRISSDMPVTAMNDWREVSRLSGVKAISLAKNGQDKEALDEAFKSIIIGNSIENSQSLPITNLVGIEIKNSGLDVLQKVISIIIKDSFVLSEYQSKLENYQAKGNSTPFSTEYLVCKQSWDNFGQDNNTELGAGMKILIKNKFYFKKNLATSYCFDFFNKLAIESEKDCSEVKKVQGSTIPLEEGNLIKMYFTENLVGKHFMGFYTQNEIGYNNVLEQKCATENKLNETILIINNSEEITLSNIQKQYDEIHKNSFKVIGEFVCLPLKDENITHNDLCVFGIKNSNNDYYRLQAPSDDKNNVVNKIQKGQKIEISGELINEESDIYKTLGTIKVMGVKYLYTEEKDIE